MRARTRLVCTLGGHVSGGGRPQDSDGYVRELVEAGMDVARVNLSHAQGATHFLDGRAPVYGPELRRMQEVRAASRKCGPERHVAVLLDLQGVKIRLRLPESERAEGRRLAAGDEVRMRLTCHPAEDEIACDASEDALAALITAMEREGGVEVAIADGDPLLTCTGVEGDVAVLRANDGGVLRHRKGVTFRGVELDAEPPLTVRDKVDVAAFALPALLRGDADFLALSFARTADDIVALRRFCVVAAAWFRDSEQPDSDEDAELLARIEALCPGLRGDYGEGDPRRVSVVAKIETRSATENLEGILVASDAVMIARGDLGLQCRPEVVPRLQKDIIRRARLLGRPAIVATQMLGSMEVAPEPTRAEASDVFNAVLDGADALMLSGETATGLRPRKAVEMLRHVSGQAAAWRDRSRFGRGMRLNHTRMDVHAVRKQHGQMAPWIEVTDRMTVEAVRIAEGLECEAVIAVSRSGQTARNIARYDPLVPVVAIVPDEVVARSLALAGSVQAVVAWGGSEADTLALGLERARRAGLLDEGMRVLVAGARAGDPPGATSVLAVRRV